MLEKIDDAEVLSGPTNRVISRMNVVGAKKISGEGAIELGTGGEFEFFVLGDGSSVVTLDGEMKW